jgi:hypothetical protein
VNSKRRLAVMANVDYSGGVTERDEIDAAARTLGLDTRTLQQHLGHKNIQHTVRYTELSPERFRDFWKD